MPPYNLGTRTTYRVEDREAAVRFQALVDISFPKSLEWGGAHPALTTQEVTGTLSSGINLLEPEFYI